MATTVVMEALSPTMEEGRLVEWKKQPGDVVAVGDVLAEVETDKAVMELVARAAGSLLQHAVAAGTTVPVGNAVAYIGQPGEAVNGGASAAPASAAPAVKAPAAPATPKDTQGTQPVPTEDRPTSMPPAPPAEAATEGHGEMVMPASGVVSAPAATPDGGRVKASPLARKLAAERGLDLGTMTGTGPEGRIVLRDVEGAKAGAKAPVRPAPAAPAAARPAAAPPRPSLVPSGESFADVPLSQMRKTIAKRLAQSIGPVPTFYLTAEADMERAAEARES
ncbi:MAG TPA: E3 binding domain-containing protein, partial [Gemmatimonadales bacterium]|nr:E3 binding domain-containing protein [Gemmatimonadales bacterium]